MLHILLKLLSCCVLVQVVRQYVRHLKILCQVSPGRGSGAPCSLCCRLLEQKPTRSAGVSFEVSPSASAQLQRKLCDGTYRKFGAKKFQIYSRAGLQPWGLR